MGDCVVGGSTGTVLGARPDERITRARLPSDPFARREGATLLRDEETESSRREAPELLAVLKRIESERRHRPPRTAHVKSADVYSGMQPARHRSSRRMFPSDPLNFALLSGLS